MDEKTATKKIETAPEREQAARETLAATEASPSTEASPGAADAEEATLPCPLCGIDVAAGSLTCPRCKSRMDAHPRTPFALADAFDAWDALGDEEATARMSLPFHTGIHTGPLPVVALEQTAAGDAMPAFQADSATEQLASPVAAPSNEVRAEDRVAFTALPEEGPACTVPAEDASIYAGAPMAPGAQEDGAGEAEYAYVPLEAKRSGRHIAGAVAAALLMVGVLAGGVHLAAQANTLNQIDDAQIMEDIRADEVFTQGSASNDFVEAAPYAVESVRLLGKEAADGGIDAHAKVGIANGFFAESQEVVVHYRKSAQNAPGEEGGWTHACEVVTSEVRPTRGISHDDEHGIAGASPVLEEGGLACHVSIPFEQEGSAWYARTTGMRTIGYAFENGAWSRTGVDEELGSATYQALIGTYSAQAGTSNSQNDWGWGWASPSSARSQGGSGELAIAWTDDSAGTFGGWLSWKETARGLFSSSQDVVASFSGTIGEDGTLHVTSDGQAGSVEFEATAAGDGALNIEGTAYAEEARLFGGSSVTGKEFAFVASKQSDEPTSMPQPSGQDAVGGTDEGAARPDESPEGGSGDEAAGSREDPSEDADDANGGTSRDEDNWLDGFWDNQGEDGWGENQNRWSLEDLFRMPQGAGGW